MAKRLVSGELKTVMTEYSNVDAKRDAIVRELETMLAEANARSHAILVVLKMVRAGLAHDGENMSIVQARALRELLSQIGGKITEANDKDDKYDYKISLV